MKRGNSGLSLIVGVDKPVGMSSHDVVNQVRTIFSEKRVGHAGTLDPLASGVLPVLVGPAAKLSNYLMGHEKTYIVRIEFGTSTTTDDSEGEVLRTGPIPDEVFDPFFATTFLKSTEGTSMQMPPAYSAIKVDGKKACNEARRGSILELTPRKIEVYSSELLSIEGADASAPPSWMVKVCVSKGTYIRSYARDIGVSLGTPAHVAALRRTRSGYIDESLCASLDVLAELRGQAALDPIKLLGYRFTFIDQAHKKAVDCGMAIHPKYCELFEYKNTDVLGGCACTSGVTQASDPLSPDEIIAMIVDNKLKALYTYDSQKNALVPACVFNEGVVRGADI